MHFISIKPVLSDHLYYVTIFDCSLGRSHKTVLTVFLLWKFCLQTNQFDFIWMSTLQWLYSTTLYSNHVNITQVHDTGMKKTQNCFDIFLVQWIHISSCYDNLFHSESTFLHARITCFTVNPHFLMLG